MVSIICRPFYLPRKISLIIVTAVYIPPQADTSLALSKLHSGSSADTLTNTLPSSRGTLTKPASGRSCRTFINISSDISKFTNVALSFVNTLTEQATETVTISTFSNQKPWVDRTIRDVVNHCTATCNAGLLLGNMSEYKASCYALRRAVRAAKFRYRERIESHFQLNDSRRMWQGLKTICSSGNKSSAEVRADLLLAKELNTFYGHFECNGGSATGHVLRSCADQLAGLFTSIFNESLATSVVPTSFKKSVIIPVPKNSKPSCLNDYCPVALTSIVMKVFERLLKNHICSSIPATLGPLQFGK